MSSTQKTPLLLMPTIPCVIDGTNATVYLGNSMFMLSGEKLKKEYPYYAIRSVHVKNADLFLLKIRIEECDAVGEVYQTSYVCSFESMHLRDLLKMLLLSVSISPETFCKNAVEHNTELKNMYTHAKPFLTNTQIINLAKASSRLPGVLLEPELYVQRGITDISDESSIRQLQKQEAGNTGGFLNRETTLNILHAFSQPLINTFILMNCSVNQFMNLIFSSYFYDQKNKKNTLDRILAESIRGFKSEVDYATRINSYSFMTLSDKGAVDGTIREKKTGMEPLPEYQMRIKEGEEKQSETIPTGTINLSGLSSSEKCVFEPGRIEERRALNFAAKDFETARELCRVVYCNGITEEIEEFSKNFTTIIVGKYGEESLKLLNRFIPSFYDSKKE